MKHKSLNIVIVIAVSLVMSLSACQAAPSQGQESPNALLQVTVSIPPQAYFVERIAGDMVSVNVMVQPGDNVHTYEPTPDQMKMVSSSQIFFSIGVEYEENWLPRFMEMNPKMSIFDTAAGIQKIKTTEIHYHEDEDDHHDEDAHADGLDPHVWLAPGNGKTIATNILNALVDLSPENETAFQDNFQDLITDIDQLEAQISTTLASLENRHFMVYHPAWGYFANQYKLTQIPVEVGGQEPSARELAELVRIAKQEQIKVIFVQPAFSTANAEALANEVGAEVVRIDPLAFDWLNNLTAVSEAFAAALSQ